MPLGDLWLASKGLVVSIRIPKYIGILVIITNGGRTIISGALNIIDALSLVLNVGGNPENFTRDFTCAHCVTSLFLRCALILPHLMFL